MRQSAGLFFQSFDGCLRIYPFCNGSKRLIGHTDNATRGSCPITFVRNVGSYYSEDPGVEVL